jgi:hypothetical protein
MFTWLIRRLLMAIQVGFASPPRGTTVPTVIADRSNSRTGAPIVRDAPRRRTAPHTTKMLLAVGGLALGLGLFVSVGTADADGLDATPMPPAVIDEDGTHNYDTSSYPADPSWPSPPSWGSWPAEPTWPG